MCHRISKAFEAVFFLTGFEVNRTRRCLRSSGDALVSSRRQQYCHWLSDTLLCIVLNQPERLSSWLLQLDRDIWLYRVWPRTKNCSITVQNKWQLLLGFLFKPGAEGGVIFLDIVLANLICCTQRLLFNSKSDILTSLIHLTLDLSLGRRTEGSGGWQHCVGTILDKHDCR